MLVVAGLFAILTALSGDRVGAIAGLLVAGAGALERHGGMLLSHGDTRGLNWAIAGEMFAMVSILAYCQVRLVNVDLETLRMAVTEPMKQQLAAEGIGIDEFLLVMNRAVFVTLAILTVFYQGGLAFYYSRRRHAIAQTLETEE